MQTKSIYIILTGRVQGVGFRYFVQHKASELHIFGWARNTPDGKLEVEAEGEPQNLATFVEWLKIGPARAFVQTFSVSDISPSRKFKNFTIR